MRQPLFILSRSETVVPSCTSNQSYNRGPLKAQTLPFGKAISVFWVDSAASYGWKPREDGDTMAIVSLGFVTKCDTDMVTISTSITNQLDVNSPLSIPWGCIFQIRELPDAFDRKLN